MKISILVITIVIGNFTSAIGQKSEVARKRAEIWFTDDIDIRLARLQNADSLEIQIWLAMGTKSDPDNDKGSIVFSNINFNWLWTPTNKRIPNAVTKYIKRWEQIPVKDAETWQDLTDQSLLYSYVSLIGENDLFPGEKFSEKAFQAFIAKFK